jgi:hypothetical protein
MYEVRTFTDDNKRTIIMHVPFGEYEDVDVFGEVVVDLSSLGVKQSAPIRFKIGSFDGDVKSIARAAILKFDDKAQKATDDTFEEARKFIEEVRRKAELQAAQNAGNKILSP